MSKRNISYIKPPEPSFLAKLKAEIGYKEGPTVDTKRQKYDDDEDSNCSDGEGNERPEREEEQPQVVVLEAGDLTAEEASAEQKRLAKEAAEAPADLNQRIIFKKKSNTNSNDKETDSSTSKKSKKRDSKKSNNSNSCSNKLSFNQEDEEDDQ